MQATSLYRPKDFTNKYDARKPWLPKSKRLIKRLIDQAESIASKGSQSIQQAKKQSEIVLSDARLCGFVASKMATLVLGIALVGVGQWLIQ